jgi:hypothetical protein
MRNKKTLKRNKKMRKTRRRNRKSSKKTKTIFSNEIVFKGGNINPPSFQSFQSSQDQYYYKVNDYNQDPSDPAVLVSGRNVPMNGGKKQRKNKQSRKNIKMMKQKGGDPILGNSTSNNTLTSFGTYDGSFIGKTLASGLPLPSNSIIDQPSYHTYNEHRLPLV